MSLNPMAPQVLSAKYELLNERIWKLAVMSVSSGKHFRGWKSVIRFRKLDFDYSFYFSLMYILNRNYAGTGLFNRG